MATVGFRVVLITRSRCYAVQAPVLAITTRSVRLNLLGNDVRGQAVSDSLGFFEEEANTGMLGILQNQMLVRTIYICRRRLVTSPPKKPR